MPEPEPEWRPYEPCAENELRAAVKTMRLIVNECERRDCKHGVLCQMPNSCISKSQLVRE